MIIFPAIDIIDSKVDILKYLKFKSFPVLPEDIFHSQAGCR